MINIWPIANNRNQSWTTRGDRGQLGAIIGSVIPHSAHIRLERFTAIHIDQGLFTTVCIEYDHDYCTTQPRFPISYSDEWVWEKGVCKSRDRKQ